MTKPITYASIIPLIGGESLGIAEALNGQHPEYVLSYSPFRNHDTHYIQYLKGKGWDGDYIHLDQNESYTPKQVDVVNSVCPCAGLSSMSVSASADSATNEWMYTSARYVLNEVKPTVFWGENAPRLYTKAGEKVANTLYEIGVAAGYSLTLYYTESRLHGSPQGRPRTYYFFTKGERAPIFPFHSRLVTPIEEILKRKTSKNDPMNIRVTKSDPLLNPFVAYVAHKYGAKTVKEIYDKVDKSEHFIHIIASGRLGEPLNEVAKWFDENGFPSAAKKARHMKMKIDDGKGYWGHDSLIAKGTIPAFVSSMPYLMINPHTEQYVTVRDGMRIMGMPDDFNLVGDPVKNVNHVCQNVGVNVAKDMMSGVLAYLRGELDHGASSFIRQSNKKKTIENAITEENSTLDTFLNLHTATNRL